MALKTESDSWNDKCADFAQVGKHGEANKCFDEAIRIKLRIY